MIDPYDKTADDEMVVSRSQIKREALELQELGRALYALPKKQRSLVPLDELLLAAFVEADRIKSGDALRRHFQYVGKLLREMDVEVIRAAMLAVKNSAKNNQVDQDQLQQTVTQLLEGGRDAAEALLSQFAALDRQQLNQLIRNAARAEEKRAEGAKETPATRKLKQYLLKAMQAKQKATK